ncbi:ATP-binding protein [Methanocella paludicola]|nr:AAA family ATPase [Methanocella paludicola]
MTTEAQALQEAIEQQKNIFKQMFEAPVDADTRSFYDNPSGTHHDRLFDRCVQVVKAGIELDQLNELVHYYCEVTGHDAKDVRIAGDVWRYEHGNNKSSSRKNTIGPFVVKSINDVINNPTKIEYLIEGWIVTGSKVLIAGPPKTIKTLLADAMAISVASGKPFLGHYRVNEVGPVLIYQAENSEAIEGNRFKRLKKAYEIPDNENLPVYYIGNQGLRLNDPQSVERLIEAIEKIKPILVIIDPLYASFDGDISEQKEVTPVLNKLTEIRDKYNCAVCIVTHTNKSANGTNAPKVPEVNTFGSQYLLAWYECGAFIGNMKGADDGTEMGDTLITESVSVMQPPKAITVKRAGRMMGTMQIVNVSVDFNDLETMGITVEPYKDVAEKSKNSDNSKVLSAAIRILGNDRMPITSLVDETVAAIKSDKSIKSKGKDKVRDTIRYAIDEGILYERNEGTTKYVGKCEETLTLDNVRKPIKRARN